MNLGPVTLGDVPLIMGIVNVTPDSFSDGGILHDTRRVDLDGAVFHAEKLVRDGAHILDVGGESTRPGALPVSAEDEHARVIPVIEALLAKNLQVAVSVDTSKAAIAHAALTAGAHIVNDVTALRDPEMASVVASHGAAIVLMHMRGEPRTMQNDAHYDDVTQDVLRELKAAVAKAHKAGITRVLIDPGLGFAKNTEHNLQLTRDLRQLTTLAPVVYGASRKRFLGEITGHAVDDRERATAAVCAIAVANGASVVRVHDVAACRDAVRVAAMVRR
jgi:dihydropteroate synthase